MKRATSVSIRFIALMIVFLYGSVGANSHQHNADRQVWRMVQDRAKDTVVQLFVQTSIFNWLQPFKAPDHKLSFGSGFFIDDKGHFISNFHVVDQACDIKIQIPSCGKEQFSASILGVCPDRDIALLKLTKDSFRRVTARLGKIPFLTFGDSDQVLRTQEILALGYPLRQEKLKSTQGIVSGREIYKGESYIQITAALNPGNSGGPSVLTGKGLVVGINTARMRTAQNIGYIIPSNDVKSIIRDLYTIKLLRTPTLGCEFTYGTPHLTRFLGNPEPGGLYVSRVSENTLLAKAGVQEGDMLYSINDYRLDAYGEANVPWGEDKVPVSALLNRFVLGDTVQVSFYRNGVLHTNNTSFQLLPEPSVRRYYPGFEKVPYQIIGGMVIMPLALNHLATFERRDKRVARTLYKYAQCENQHTPRLLVTHVFPTSQVQESRSLQVGDLITQVNGKPVFTLDDLQKAFNNAFDNASSSKLITLKTEDKKLIVLSIDRMLRDELRLSKQYHYKKSALVASLEKNVRQLSQMLLQ